MFRQQFVTLDAKRQLQRIRSVTKAAPEETRWQNSFRLILPSQQPGTPIAMKPRWVGHPTFVARNFLLKDGDSGEFSGDAGLPLGWACVVDADAL